MTLRKIHRPRQAMYLYARQASSSGSSSSSSPSPSASPSPTSLSRGQLDIIPTPPPTQVPVGVPSTPSQGSSGPVTTEGPSRVPGSISTGVSLSSTSQASASDPSTLPENSSSTAPGSTSPTAAAADQTQSRGVPVTTFVITNGLPTRTDPSVLSTYSFSSTDTALPTPTAPASTKSVVTAVGTIMALLVVGAIVAGVMILRRRRRQGRLPGDRDLDDAPLRTGSPTSFIHSATHSDPPSHGYGVNGSSSVHSDPFSATNMAASGLAPPVTYGHGYSSHVSDQLPQVPEIEVSYSSDPFNPPPEDPFNPIPQPPPTAAFKRLVPGRDSYQPSIDSFYGAQGAASNTLR